MITDFIRAFIAGYLAPRASAEQILASRGGFPEAALMVVLGYALTMVLLIVTPGVELPEQAHFVDRHVVGLISAFVGFFIYSGLISFFGRVSGGSATLADCQMIVGWHSIVTAPLSVPVQIMALGFSVTEVEGKPPVIELPEGQVVMLGAAAVLISFWLLANYVFVAHRFRNFWGVTAVVVGIPAGLGLFMFNSLGALATLSQQGVGQ